MKKIILVAAFLLIAATVNAGEYQQLYYFSNGNYYHWNGGNHGQLYYWENGYYHEYHNREKIVLVPKAIEVEVHREHYFSIRQDEVFADAVAFRVALMLKNKATASTPASGTGRASTGAVAEIEPKAGAYQNADLLAVINESCAKCHGATSKHTRLITADGKNLNDLSAGKVWECFGLVNSGEMPKGGKAIPNEKVKLFYDWAKNARASNAKVSLGSRPDRSDRDDGERGTSTDHSPRTNRLAYSVGGSDHQSSARSSATPARSSATPGLRSGWLAGNYPARPPRVPPAAAADHRPTAATNRRPAATTDRRTAAANDH